METLFGGQPRWSDGDDRPPTLDAHNVIGYPFFGSDEVGLTSFLPVNSTCSYVLAQKGEYFGRCIVKEQKGGTRCGELCCCAPARRCSTVLGGPRRGDTVPTN